MVTNEVARTTSKAGVLSIMQREGTRLKAYKDSVGVWTIGVGHTGRATGSLVKPGQVITNVEAQALLADDLKPMEACVSQTVHRPLTQNQFDALVSLCFNIGPTAFTSSTVVREINDGNMHEAADAILMWNKPPELMARRYQERAQFLTS